jgi:hypothetical protein
MNFLRYFWLSCSGFRTYIPLLNLSLKSSLGYWAAFSFFLAGAVLLIITYWFKIAFPLIEKEAVDHLPPFAITNGQAYSSIPQPYITNTNDFPIILDFENKINSPKTTYPHGGLQIGKKDMNVWVEDMVWPPLSWSLFPNGEINKAYLEKLGQETLRRLPYLFPSLWLSLMLVGLIQALLFTMFAGFLERSLDPNFQFSQLFNISLFALTPSSLFVTLYASIGFTEISYGLLYFACYCFFVIMASGACRSFLRPPSEKDSRESHLDEDE